MIIISGATGHLGSMIARRLLGHVPAEGVGVSVRDPSKARDLADLGVRVRAGDFTRPETLTHAFEGAEQVLVVSAAIRGDAAQDANTAAIDAAVAAGAGRVVYTSHQAAAKDSLFPPQPVHAATEQHLARSGVAFAALRNGFYASALDVHLDSALSTGRIVVPEDGPVSWTAHADLADAAVHALMNPETVAGITAPLTASRALDLGELAGILTQLTGRPIMRVVVDDDEWKATAVGRGLPAAVADFSLGMFRAARRGEFDVVDPALEAFIGRRPLPVEATLRELLRARQIVPAA